MSSALTDANLEKKFRSVTNTQDSIQTLSLWLLHHRSHHKKIVSLWMKILKRSKPSHRLTLFYLANDVIQISKRKGFAYFKESFAEVLRGATLLLRDDQIRYSVNRVLNIWKERTVYDFDFIEELQGALSEGQEEIQTPKPKKFLAEFDSAKMIEKLKTVSKLETEAAMKTATANVSKLNTMNPDIVAKLKDRSHGQQFSCEYDETANSLEDLIQLLSKLVAERTELIQMIEQSEKHYNTQISEVKVVVNAYKNFSGRVKGVQKKLEEIMETFPNPTPSPPRDAPSPTSSDELELPEAKSSSSDAKDDAMNFTTSHSPLQSSFKSSTTTNTVGGTVVTFSSSYLQQHSKNATGFVTSFQKNGDSMASASVDHENSVSNLDHRVSDLFQNISTLPRNVSSAVEEASNADIMDSPVSFPSHVKDKYSGQSTPVQDEDTPIISTATFFTGLDTQVMTESSKLISSLSTLNGRGKPSSTTTSNNSRRNSSETSLDNRLSAILQNIPNLPAGLQDTILGASAPEIVTNSPSFLSKSRNPLSSTDTSIPVKDSGQSTPVRDEDPSFFNTASNSSVKSSFSKTSQSSQDMLRGLTSFIHSASAPKEKRASRNERSNQWHTENVKPIENICKIASLANRGSSSVSNPSLAPPQFFSSSKLERFKGEKTVPSCSSETASLPQSYSKSKEHATVENKVENVSYIPTLISSVPTRGRYGFSQDNNLDEYDPFEESFEQEMDVDSMGEGSVDTPVSEWHSNNSPYSPDDQLESDNGSD